MDQLRGKGSRGAGNHSLFQVNPELRLWLEKAEEDCLAAEWLLQEESPVVLPAVFHIQQSVEKFLKGYLTFHAIHFEKKHDLTYLLSLAPRSALDDFNAFCEELAPFAVEIRYPGDTPPMNRKEGLVLLERLIQLRKVIYETIEAP